MSDILDGRSASTVTCWTVQHHAVWQRLQDGKPYRASARHIDPDYRPAYDWLVEQTRQRLAGATDRYPIWAYAHVHRSSLRLQLNSDAEFGALKYLLVCQLPANRVLLTDYTDWHDVLNGFICAPDHDAAMSPSFIDAWYDRVLATIGQAGLDQALTTGRWPAPFQGELEQSWQQIFDIEHSLRRYPEATVQATFEELRPRDVMRAIPLSRPGVSSRRRIANIVRYL